MLMDSVPPARITSAWPSMMRSAAMAMACRPEEQKRLMVMAENFHGQAGAQRGDARDVHALLGFGHGAAQDHVFDFFGVEAGTRSMAALMAMAARSSGRVARSVPLPALPTAVRTELTITASRMFTFLIGVLRVLDAVSHQKATTVLNVPPASLPALSTAGINEGRNQARSEPPIQTDA